MKEETSQIGDAVIERKRSKRVKTYVVTNRKRTLILGSDNMLIDIFMAATSTDEECTGVTFYGRRDAKRARRSLRRHLRAINEGPRRFRIIHTGEVVPLNGAEAEA